MRVEHGDLTPEEWEETVTAVHAATAGMLNDKTVVVRSHLWPQDDGTYDWIVVVPGTEHRAEGNSPSIPACYAAINVHLVEWYPEAADPATRMTVARIVPEERHRN